MNLRTITTLVVRGNQTLAVIEDHFAFLDGLLRRQAAVFFTKAHGTASEHGAHAQFEKALGRLPTGIPVNVILMPMEGDPMAPTAFWALTRKTKGIFLSPSRDWP